jgi:hypothetical protein
MNRLRLKELVPVSPLYGLASSAAFLAAGLSIVFGIGLLMGSVTTLTSWVDVAAGASLYILSQILRSIRLAIIVGDPGKSLRRLVQAHLIGAAASFCLPYKIGDALRVMELAFVLRRGPNLGIWRGVLIMWIERVYDALPIAILLAFLGLTIGTEALHLVLPVLAALIGFIIATLLIFFVLPENLDGLALFLARRYHGHRVVQLLRTIDKLYRLTADARRMLHRKHITLITISSLIWTAEIAVVALILGQKSIGSSATILLRFLSGILSPTYSRQFDNFITFSTIIGIPLLLLGLVAWVFALSSGRLRVLSKSIPGHYPEMRETS